MTGKKRLRRPAGWRRIVRGEEMIDYSNCDGVGLAEHVKKGDVSSLELVNEVQRRAELSADVINAVVMDYFDHGRESIGDVNADGPLAGVPLLLKNLLAQAKGTVTTHSMAFLKDLVADHDSELVARLKAAGLIIVGKTNSPEFGYSVTTEPKMYGATRNPWNPEKSSGGSSGGAAAAVAAGIVPFAHASDGGGSIRIPASFCGCVGLKVSRGRSTYAPDYADFWIGSAVEGCISKTVRDTAAFADIAMSASLGDPYELPPFERPLLEEIQQPPGILTVGVIGSNSDGVAVDAECAKSVETAASMLESMGHDVEYFDRDCSWDALCTDFALLACAEFTAVTEALESALGCQLTSEDMSRVNWQRSEFGKTISATDYIGVAERLRMIGRNLAAQNAKYDVVLSPTLPRTAPVLGELNMYDLSFEDYNEIVFDLVYFTLPYNISGEPAVSLPLAESSEGMPIGVQLSARRGEEAKLLRLAADIERAAPWFDRRPPNFFE